MRGLIGCQGQGRLTESDKTGNCLHGPGATDVLVGPVPLPVTKCPFCCPQFTAGFHPCEMLISWILGLFVSLLDFIPNSDKDRRPKG